MRRCVSSKLRRKEERMFSILLAILSRHVYESMREYFADGKIYVGLEVADGMESDGESIAESDIVEQEDFKRLLADMLQLTDESRSVAKYVLRLSRKSFNLKCTQCF